MMRLFKFTLVYFKTVKEIKLQFLKIFTSSGCADILSHRFVCLSFYMSYTPTWARGTCLGEDLDLRE